MKNAYRIGYWRYRTDDEFTKLKAFIARHMEVIDELALFCEFSHHGFFPQPWWIELGGVLKKRISDLKEMGVPGVGLNVLCTLGHMDEAWDVLPKSEIGTMVGPDGYVTTSNLCQNSPGYERYIINKYKALAVSNPDFIWLDDDIRMDNHGVQHACYCPNCINKYNSDNGSSYTRESLIADLNSPECNGVRQSWTGHLSDTLTRVCKIVSDAVYSVNPDIKIGLMTCGRLGLIHARNDLNKWMGVMNAVKGRPGGGFYEDSAPIGWVHKALVLEEQIILYSPGVADIQYEMENFPYQRLCKSLISLRNECTGALMNGANGIAYNAMNLEDYDELLYMVKEYTPLWSEIVRFSDGWRNAGVTAYLDPDYNSHKKTDGDFFDYSRAAKVGQSNIFAEIGVPLTASDKNSYAYLLFGPMAEALTDDQIREMLSSGVMMDGEALTVLTSRGYGALCGVEVDKVFDNGMREIITDLAFNELPFEFDLPYIRDPFITFWRKEVKCYSLKPLSDSVRVISILNTVLGDNIGPCSTLFENSTGGRVAVMGFVAWSALYSPQKRYQILTVVDWLTKGMLPVRIDKCVKVAPFVKKDPDTGKMLIMLTNAFLDPTGIFDIRIRAPIGLRAYRITMSGNTIPLPSRRAGNELIISAALEAWEFIIIKVE